MLPGPISNSAAFLRTAFGLAALNPSGLRCGMRVEGGLVSKSLAANRDGAWFAFEEMADAAARLATPGPNVLCALEPTNEPIDLNRRLYLDDFQVSANRTGQTLTTIVGMEYRRFSHLKVVGEGRRVAFQGLQRGNRPERLGLNYSYSTPALSLQQKESVSFLKGEADGDVSEISVQFRRNDFLRRLFGFREKGVASSLPWEPDPDSPGEYLDLALRLAGLFYVSDPQTLRDGFMFMNLHQEDSLPNVGPFIPVSEWYPLKYDAAGKPLLTNLSGHEVSPSGLRLNAPNHLITSMATQEVFGSPKAVLAIGWSPGGFRVEQRRVLSSGLSVFPAMADLATLAQWQIDLDLDAFDRLDAYDRMGSLAAYYSLLTGEKRADC